MLHSLQFRPFSTLSSQALRAYYSFSIVFGLFNAIPHLSHSIWSARATVIRVETCFRHLRAPERRHAHTCKQLNDCYRAASEDRRQKTTVVCWLLLLFGLLNFFIFVWGVGCPFLLFRLCSLPFVDSRLSLDAVRAPVGFVPALKK